MISGSLSRRLRTVGAACATAALLTGCISASAGPNGVYATPIGNAPVTANPTPYSAALYCMADYARRYNLPSPRIAVGRIADYTGTVSADGGRTADGRVAGPAHARDAGGNAAAGAGIGAGPGLDDAVDNQPVAVGVPCRAGLRAGGGVAGAAVAGRVAAQSRRTGGLGHGRRRQGENRSEYDQRGQGLVRLDHFRRLHTTTGTGRQGPCVPIWVMVIKNRLP